MPGGDIHTESLEQRIERIRKRDEEIERRHREAEADRLAALQANALVKIKAPDDEDWPKAHKYDKLDFTYDVKVDNIEEHEQKVPEETQQRLQRPFKRFDDLPADPTYNFLAEPERDGKPSTNCDKSNDNKKDWRSNNNNNNNNNNGTGLNRRNNNNNSFNRGKSGAKAKTKQQNSMDETSSRKSDSDRSSDEKFKRTKSIEGNWREKTDNDIKNDRKKPIDRQKKGFRNDATTINDDIRSNSINKKSIQQRLGTSKPKTDINNLPEKLTDLSIEKRGNITVSVTKDGEVKSVKLEATRTFGTGRVGNGRPQIVQTPNEPVLSTAESQQLSYQPPTLVTNKTSPINIDSNLNQLNTLNNVIDYTQFQSQPFEPVTIPKSSSNIVNGAPFKLPSIQERLTKNRVFFDEKLKNTVQNTNSNN